MAKNTETTIIEISPKSILLILGIIFGLWFFYTIRSIVVMVFLAFIITSTVKGPIDWLIAHKIPKGVAIFLVYIFLIILIGAFLSAVAAPIAQETIRFLKNLPEIFDSIVKIINDIGLRIGLLSKDAAFSTFEKSLDIWVNNASKNLGDLLKTGASGAFGILDIASSIFGSIASTIAVLVISMYMSFDYTNAIDGLLRQIPSMSLREKVGTFVYDVEKKLGRWLIGQIVSASILATLTWAILSVLGMQYALPLGLLTGLLNPIPYIGATLSAIPGIIVALASGSAVQIIGAPIAFFAVQQIESQLITPRVMANVIGLPPIITILAVLIGGRIGGVAGIVLAVPIAGVMHLAVQFAVDLREDHKD